MATWFVSRHRGAIAWAKKQPFYVDHWVEHLSLDMIAPADVVIGSLPIQLVAELCERNIKYRHLSLNIPPELRGKELSADQLDLLDAQLETFFVTRIKD